jgi:hypothetical protein
MEHNQIPSSDEEPFSGDPKKNLEIENEILRMRVKAELGGAYEGSENLPPEIENEFLKNILAFEHKYANTKQVKVLELLGSPVIKPAAELSDDEIDTELEMLEELMEQKSMVVEFIKPRTNRFKYQFISEELMEHETDDMQLEGMTKYFTYEEFHPDHLAELEELTRLFLLDWFEQSMDESSWYLDEKFIDPNGPVLSRAALAIKIGHVFDAYNAFEEAEFTITDCQFEFLRDVTDGMEAKGFSEGTVSYSALLESGELQKIAGPFKCYFTRQEGSWSIYYFTLTGFNL